MVLARRMQTRNSGPRSRIIEHETAIFVKKKEKEKYLIKSADVVSVSLV
jgi:hypothetical protein